MSMSFDKSMWDKAILEISKEMKGTLADLMNKSLYFVLVRTFASLEPKDPAGQRAKNKAYLNEVLVTKIRLAVSGKRAGKFISTGAKHMLRRVHLIAQARRIKHGEKALNPRQLKAGFADAMKKEAAPIRRSAIGGVGYLKGAIVKAISTLSKSNGFGSFSQFGFGAKIKDGAVIREEVKANAFLASIASEYGLTSGNVGIHKHTRSSAKLANPAHWNPVAEASFSFGVHDAGKAGAEARYNAALAKGFSEELNEKLQRLAEARISAIAAEHNAA